MCNPGVVPVAVAHSDPSLVPLPGWDNDRQDRAAPQNRLPIHAGVGRIR